MGVDFDQYVHPERISNELICPICTVVLENPVQTETEHLFCESELLEWMTRSNLCPVTHTLLDPKCIRKPGRIILNMLAELEMFCPNRNLGCVWTGSKDNRDRHYEDECKFHEPIDLEKEVNSKNELILLLQEELESSRSKVDALTIENEMLIDKLSTCEAKLRIFEALSESVDSADVNVRLRDVDRLQRLRQIDTKVNRLGHK
eukprot:gene13662-18334_t